MHGVDPRSEITAHYARVIHDSIDISLTRLRMSPGLGRAAHLRADLACSRLVASVGLRLLQDGAHAGLALRAEQVQHIHGLSGFVNSLFGDAAVPPCSAWVGQLPGHETGKPGGWKRLYYLSPRSGR